MKFSELWLREWVNPNIDTNKLCEQLTMLGLEVENVSSVSSFFHGVVSGEIVECKEKLDCHKIKFTKVNIGNGKILNIMCNADNCRLGLKVVVAPIKTILPKQKEVQQINFYEYVSEGIICSLSTLGLSDKEDQFIIELPHDVSIGKDIYNYLKLNDNIIEVNITPNRADCLSIMGIARDLAALNCLPFENLINNPISPKINDDLLIYIHEPKACPQYLSRIIKDINVNISTPFWIKERLRRCGIASVNVVIDINNYVLIEIGQPIFAFDLDCIDSYLAVRMAKDNEILILNNGKKIHLNNTVLVISDKNKVLSIAGVCNDLRSTIHDSTRDILLECAYFNPLSVINNIRYCNLHTDTSHRYERGIDYKLQYKAIEYVTKLLMEICKGKAGPIIDKTYDRLFHKSKLVIDLHRKKLNRLIGYKISDSQVNDTLTRLGFNIHKEIDKWKVIVPSWRVDILIEEDLLEEIIRIFGYYNIPNVPIKTNLKIIAPSKGMVLLKRIKNFLVNMGYHEVITYSFVNPKIQKILHPNKHAVPIMNPISKDMSVMRLSLRTGLLNILHYNQNYQQNRLRLFENGYCFIPDKTAEFGIRQELMLSGILNGNISKDHWDKTNKLADFYDLKGDLESLFELSNHIEDINFFSRSISALHPGKSAVIYLNDKEIGYIGEIHPDLQKRLKIKNEIVIFELMCNELINSKHIRIQEISRFPANRRDISIIVNEQIPAANVITLCKKIGINQLVGINLLDVYRGKDIAKGYKSLTISLILQDTKRTLKEEEIAIIVNRYIMALKERFQVTLRN
ncbi:phenylalanine--tRNA ligase subunit beta [Candidatus Pantoea edessiphila]|uniref:Phenylalanine--tRNA ligase beta subunit n=1 Tax=Candidatus Pantoea edessiphila TaxID=2044610 RepID=A0A2P5SYR4_9GAMM|nr:phenylalanine--tRNA ligase subunit beta [Candidatus Pantoea edessiphila]MBK4775382.1 phenylalanine--tRNA ligase subunit beta [Pantoea sp. Edef]PPI87487.1 phenylalanine--tRNA ligase subunit beta [Candidatus Pantoea edessiphila]